MHTIKCKTDLICIYRDDQQNKNEQDSESSEQSQKDSAKYKESCSNGSNLDEYNPYASLFGSCSSYKSMSNE